MTDQTPFPTTPSPAATVPAGEATIVEPTRLQMFVLNHPRLARVVAIIGGLLAFFGVVTVATTVKKNKHHVELAAAHASDSVQELGHAVSPLSHETPQA